MRRTRLVPLLAIALILGACSSNSPSTPRTVTQIVTATGTPPTTVGTGGGITVVPGGSGSSGASGTGSTASSTAPGTGGTATSGTATGQTGTSGATPTSSPVTSTSPAKIVKVNPLKVACTSLLDASDIHKVLGASVSSSSTRIVDVANPQVKMTGKVKCYYGVKTGSKDRPVTVALAQYVSAEAAQKQMDVTAQSEIGLGAQASSVTVSGFPARVLLRDGGLLVMRYDTWTLAVAIESKLAPAAKLPTGMQQLATMVLARVLKNG